MVKKKKAKNLMKESKKKKPKGLVCPECGSRAIRLKKLLPLRPKYVICRGCGMVTQRKDWGVLDRTQEFGTNDDESSVE